MIPHHDGAIAMAVIGSGTAPPETRHGSVVHPRHAEILTGRQGRPHGDGDGAGLRCAGRP